MDAAVDAPEDVVQVDEALQRLAALDARMARIVELRFFAGLSNEETAAVLWCVWADGQMGLGDGAGVAPSRARGRGRGEGATRVSEVVAEPACALPDNIPRLSNDVFRDLVAEGGMRGAGHDPHSQEEPWSAGIH